MSEKKTILLDSWNLVQSAAVILHAIDVLNNSPTFSNMETGDVVIASTQEDLSASFSTEQPPIVTFDEWTKEKLKKEEIRRAEQQQVIAYVLF